METVIRFYTVKFIKTYGGVSSGVGLPLLTHWITAVVYKA